MKHTIWLVSEVLRCEENHRKDSENEISMKARTKVKIKTNIRKKLTILLSLACITLCYSYLTKPGIAWSQSGNNSSSVSQDNSDTTPSAAKTNDYVSRNIDIINKANVATFSDNIIGPLDHLIAKKNFTLFFFNDTKKSSKDIPWLRDWSWSEQWDKATEQNGNKFFITRNDYITAHDSPTSYSSGGSYPAQSYTAGLLFSRDLTNLQTLGAKLRAQMILANMKVVLAAPANLLYRGDLIIFGGNSYIRKSKFSLFRQNRIDETPGFENLLLFREVLSFVAPQNMRGFSISTKRFFSGEPDYVEIFSPVLTAMRQVEETNRQDLLLDSNLSTEDMFLFSGNPSSYSAKVVDEKKLIVPISKLSLLKTNKTQVPSDYIVDINPSFQLQSSPTVEGDTVEFGGDTPRPSNFTLNTWNLERKQLQDAPPFNPIGATYLQRDTWVLELIPKDPFALASKIVLFIDKTNYLPWLKLIYNRDGSYARMSMASWAVAGSRKSEIYPVLMFVLSVDANNKDASAFSTDEVYYNLRGKTFSPSQHFQFPSKGKSASNNDTKTPDSNTDEEDNAGGF